VNKYFETQKVVPSNEKCVSRVACICIFFFTPSWKIYWMQPNWFD